MKEKKFSGPNKTEDNFSQEKEKESKKKKGPESPGGASEKIREKAKEASEKIEGKVEEHAEIESSVSKEEDIPQGKEIDEERERVVEKSKDDLNLEWEKTKEALYKADKEKDEESYNKNYQKIKEIEIYKNLLELENERSKIKKDIEQAEKEQDEKTVLEAEERIRKFEKEIDAVKKEINEKEKEDSSEEYKEGEDVEYEENVEKEPVDFEKEILDAFAEFNISEKDLESIEGFKDLNTGAQFLIAKNLANISLEEVKSEVKKEQQSAYKDKNFFSKIGAGISNVFKKREQEKVAVERQKSGGLEKNKENLENLTSMLKSMEIKGELIDGKQFFKFADKENASPEKQEVYNQFNEAANLWAEIPEHFNEKYASKEQKKQYKKALENYQNLKEELLKGEDTKKAEEVNNIDLQISLLKTMNANPDLEKDWNNMGKSSLKKFFTNLDKPGYLAAGYGARTLTAGLVGVAAVPLTAAGLGAWRGFEKGKKKLRESDKEKSKREGTNKVSENSIDKKTELSENLGGKVERLLGDYKNEDNERKKIEILKMIDNRLKFSKDKLSKDLVNFGSSQKKSKNLLDFYQNLSKAEILLKNEKENLPPEDLEALGYMVDDKEVNINERVEKALKTYEEITEKKLSKNRRNFLFKKVKNGALMSGAFALAGVGIREGVEAFKEVGDEAVEEVSEGVSEATFKPSEESIDVPEEPIAPDSELTESMKEGALDKSELFNELRQSGELSKVISNEGLEANQTDSIWRSAREIFLKNPEELGFEGDLDNAGELRSWADNQVGNAINRMDDVTDKVYEGNIVSLELNDSDEYVINIYNGDKPGYLPNNPEINSESIKPAFEKMDSIKSSGLNIEESKDAETEKGFDKTSSKEVESKVEDIESVNDEVESSIDSQEPGDIEEVATEEVSEAETLPKEAKEPELTPEEIKGEKLGKAAAESYFDQVSTMRKSDEIFNYVVRNQNSIPEEALKDMENTFNIGGSENVFGRVRGGTETSLANELNRIVGDEDFYQSLNENKQEEFRSIFNRLVNGPVNSRSLNKRRLISLIGSIENK